MFSCIFKSSGIDGALNSGAISPFDLDIPVSNLAEGYLKFGAWWVCYSLYLKTYKLLQYNTTNSTCNYVSPTWTFPVYKQKICQLKIIQSGKLGIKT